MPSPLEQDRPEPTRALVRALQQQADKLAAGIPGQDAQRVAAAWVYMTAVTAWAEDHGLVAGRLRVEQGGTHLAWLTYAVADTAVHPCGWPLLDPDYDNPVRWASPSEDSARGLLDWWAVEAPALAYPVQAGPATITGWLIGDLLQHLTDERRLAHALAQSPWWLAGGILDRTLIPAAREAPDRTLRMVDPACGTGHFLVVAVEALWELYTTGRLAPRQMRMDGVTGWTPVPPAEAARRILAGVHGMELDPVTAAVARLRVTVTLAHLLHTAGVLPGPLRLATIPHTVLATVGVGDSLLAGKVGPAEYARLRPAQARIVNLGAEGQFQQAPEPNRPASPEPTVTPLDPGTDSGQLPLFPAA